MAEEIIKFSIDAVDDADNIETLPCELSNRRPLRDLARLWAKEFDVEDVENVGIADENGELVDLNATPQELGWRGHVKLNAVPLFEQDSQVSPVPVAGHVDAANKGAKRAPSGGASGGVGGPSVAKRPAGVAGIAATAGATPAKKGRIDSDRKTAKDLKPAAVTVPTSHAATKAPTNMKALAGKKIVTPTAAVTKTKVPPVPNFGKLPEGDEAVVFQKPNPKRPGTAAFARYGKYMKAKTVKMAFKLGAARGDIEFDFKKGFLTRP
eukprot:TRINITY_DN606_c0_g2_i1.p1 TRINITY_DN606_c0_g2~~TRINITY_DN606_c0_g2_i1.p1  ORF type:complete len:289 (+),score=59.91 TRINITY_DN606_c0_g2_i1:72-869(+)